MSSSSSDSCLQDLLSENATFMSELSVLVLGEDDPGIGRTLANLILSQGYFGDLLQKVGDGDSCRQLQPGLEIISAN